MGSPWSLLKLLIKEGFYQHISKREEFHGDPFEILQTFDEQQTFDILYGFEIQFKYTVEPCILEQIDYLWGLAMAKPMI